MWCEILKVFLLVCLGVAVIYDVKYRIVPHVIPIILTGVWCVAEAIQYVWGYFECALILNNPRYALVSACGLLVFLVLINAGMYVFMKHDGLGGGDIKLLTSLALYIGMQGSLWVLFFACILFLAVVSVEKIRTHTVLVNTTSAFVPYIAIGYVLYSLFI
ncbi:MAG: prepilin peptidase [Eggerthellaceae bacterium]|nr:prepilin peptidase [Eggerthellaceae bacterium]